MMTKLAIVVCLVVALAVCSSAQDDADQWEKFKETHKKKFANPRDEAKRRLIFAETDRLIKLHNAKDAAGWKMAHNKFSDMTPEEKQDSLGLSASIRDTSPTEANNVRVARSLLQVAATSIDLRTDVCMPPVRDQGQCGSCWAFATLPPLEYAHCKKTGTLLNLSEQQLVDCSPYDNGCNGGFYTNAWYYLKYFATYSTTEAAYPYSSGTSKTNGTCRASNTTSATMPQTRMATLSYSRIASDSAAIANAVSTYGPIAVAFYVDNAFFSYSSGVYTTEYCKTMTPLDSINHGVVIVGYGTENGVPFWIVRNSWGAGWGIQGYVKYLRGANQCNIESRAYYVTL